MVPLVQAAADPASYVPDRLGVWWLAPPEAFRQIRQLLKHHMRAPLLVGTPMTPLRWPLGFQGLWEAGMGSPHADQAFIGRQWRLSPDHPWVQEEVVAHKVATQLMKAFKVPGAALLVASWNSQGLLKGQDSMALRLKMAGVLGDTLLMSTFQLEPSQTWSVVKGIEAVRENDPRLDLVGASVEVLMQKTLRKEWGPEQQEGWRRKRRAWQLNRGLPLPQASVGRGRF